MNTLASNEKTKLNRGTARIVGCVLFFLLLLSATLYTFIHEGGHALLGVLFGGRITSFSINFFDLSAHVGLDGQFSLAQRALISAAGVSLPILVGMLLLLLSAKRDDIILYFFKAIFFMMAVNALLAWMVIPVLAMLGKSVSDDSSNFLNLTHISPLLETGVAVLVYIFCWVLFFSQMGGAGVVLKRLRSASIDLTLPQTRNSLLSLAAAGIVALAVAFGLELALPNTTFNVPAGYQQVAELDLSKNSLSNQSIYRFTLDTPTRVNLYFLLNNVNGAPVNIRLTGPAGYETVFLSMTDPNTTIGQASVTPQTDVLEKGVYEIRVSFPACMGKVRAYLKMEGR